MPEFLADHPQNTIVTDPNANNAVQIPSNPNADARSVDNHRDDDDPETIITAAENA